MTNKFEEYALLDAQVKEIEAKKDQIKVHILKEMVEKGEDKIDTSVGKFSITKLKKWTYPDYVEKLGEDYKTAKAKSESIGEAKYTESESLRFTGIKL